MYLINSKNFIIQNRSIWPIDSTWTAITAPHKSEPESIRKKVVTLIFLKLKNGKLTI